MRPCAYGLLSAFVIFLGGCSHLSPDQNAAWSTRTTAEQTASSKDGRKKPAPAYSNIKPATLRTTPWTPETINQPDWSQRLITPVSASGPHAVAHTDGPYLLDSGDQLRVFVYGQPNLSRIYTVDHVGNIIVPFIGSVRAQRRTTYQLARIIRRRLGAKFIRDPQVTVDMQQHRPFFILGEVRNPGQYPYVNGMTVETAVAIAGGYTPRASESGFRISRRVDGIVEVAKGGIDYVVRPGDTIKVRERFF
jgi:polysaccharide biosynthesis/export protein